MQIFVCFYIHACIKCMYINVSMFANTLNYTNLDLPVSKLIPSFKRFDSLLTTYTEIQYFIPTFLLSSCSNA